MTPFKQGALEGFGYFVGTVVSVAAGFAVCFGAIGIMKMAWNWMGTVMRGGCQ